MARTFQNPANNHVEVVGTGSSWGAFFLGWVYLAFKGLWGHFLVWLLVVSMPIALVDAYTLIFTIPLLSIFYGMAIQGILSTRYLRRGWREVGDSVGNVDEVRTPPTVAPSTSNAASQQPADAETKNCPYCAETIKAAAIRCKHCQADLSASTSAAASHGQAI